MTGTLVRVLRRLATKPSSGGAWSVQELLRAGGRGRGRGGDTTTDAEVSDEVLDRLSSQACLPLDNVDREALKADLARTIAFIEQVQDIDTTGVEPLVSLSELSHDHLRKDEHVPASTVDVLANAPERFQDFFVAPRESHFHVDHEEQQHTQDPEKSDE